MTPRNLVAWLALLNIVSAAAAQPPSPPEPSNAPDRPPVIADTPVAVDPATLLPPALAAKTSVVFRGESLLEVAEWFSREHGVTVLFDRGAIREIGVSLGEPVYDRLDDQPLYLLLARLQMLELAWYESGGVVTVTSEDDAETRLTTTPYNLGDLLDAGYERERVLDTVLTTVATSSWAEVGGGEAEAQWLGDVLFVSQTAAGHGRVAGLFAALRDHGRRTFVYDPPEHETLRQKLDQPIGVDLVQAPLVVAIEKIAEAAGADIRLDRAGAEVAGVRERTPVTVSLEDRSLRTVLQAVTRDLDLAWVVRDGVLWVTSEEAAATRFKTAVYDVRDLCRDADEGDALVDAIVSHVAPETWAGNGGGEAEVRFAKEGVMVVHQTEQNHGRLLSLLERYREALRQSKPRPREEDDPDEVLVRYYRMPTPMAESLASALPQLVPVDWGGELPGSILVVASADVVERSKSGPPRVTPHATLIVEQTRAAHEQIAEVIARVRSGDTPLLAPGGGLGGGGFGGGFFSLPASPSAD